MGSAEHEGLSLPLTFLLNEQINESLPEAWWVAVGGVRPRPRRQSDCLNVA